MFAEIVFASLIAVSGQAAAGEAPAASQPAVIRSADAGRAAPRVHLAADLGCPRYYDRRRGYGDRCYRRDADPYHNGPRDRYGRYERDRYSDEDYGRYSNRRAPYDGDERYQDNWNGPRDTLRDRYGRPYPETAPGADGDVPPYRRGGYTEPGPREPYYDRSEYYEEPPRGRRGDDFDRFRDDRAPDAYYQRSNYREPLNKKKDTDPMTNTTTRSRNAASAVGSTV